MIRTQSKLGRIALAGLGLSLVLTGCQGVPSNGDVQAGLSDLRQAEEQVVFDPTGPLPGATQEEIVRGFLTAQSSANNNYAVAREFLTPEFASKWKADEKATIDEGSRPFKQADDNKATVSVSEIATVNPAGLLTPSGNNSEATELQFEFARIGGEWRIAKAPNGVIMDRTLFTTVWMQVPLQFVSDAGTAITDTRWFVNDSKVLDSVVSEMVAGPSNFYDFSARRVVPSTLKLTKSVKVENGTAEISLSDDVHQVAPADLDIFVQQLRATLLSLNALNSFVLTDADGTQLRRQELTEVTALTPQTNPYLMASGSFGEYRNGALVPEQDISAKLSALHPLAATVGSASTSSAQQGLIPGLITERAGVDPASAELVGKRVAALTADSVTAVTVDETVKIDTRAKLLAPSMDAWGVIWTAAPETDETLQAVTFDGEKTLFRLPDIDRSGLRAISVSPDGGLLALLVSSDNQTSVYVAGIARDVSGVPAGIDPTAHLVSTHTGSALDLAWMSNHTLAVMTRTSDASKVTTVALGGFKTERGSVVGGITLYAVDESRAMRVLTSDGVLYRPQGTSAWQTVASKIDLLVKRG